MAFFALSGITGCIDPSSASTSEAMYNEDMIIEYHKKDILVDFNNVYMVTIIMGNHMQNFQFSGPSGSTYRDDFYNSLPK